MGRTRARLLAPGLVLLDGHAIDGCPAAFGVWRSAFVNLLAHAERRTDHPDDGRRVRAYGNRDDVESARGDAGTPPGEVIGGHQRELAALDRGHGLLGRPMARRPARLHLDEHQDRAVEGDDVDFAEPGAVAPLENCVPPALEGRAGEIFAGFSEGEVAGQRPWPNGRSKRTAIPAGQADDSARLSPPAALSPGRLTQPLSPVSPASSPPR